MSINRYVLIVMFALVLCACGKQVAVHGEDDKNTASTVLATVNDSHITENDLELAMRRMDNSAANIARNNDQVRQNILESLIDSRSLAILAKQKLPSDVVLEIEAKVRLYEEELFAKKLIDEFVQPKAVSEEMIQQYYQSNLSLFGAEPIKKFEYVIFFDEQANKETREAAINQFAKLSPNTDFRRFAEQLKQKGINVQHKVIDIQASLLDEPLASLVAKTSPNSLSKVYVEDRVIRVKVLSERTSSAKPLSEVSGEIRQILAPAQIQQAVRDLVEQARAEMNIKNKTQ